MKKQKSRRLQTADRKESKMNRDSEIRRKESKKRYDKYLQALKENVNINSRGYVVKHTGSGTYNAPFY